MKTEMLNMVKKYTEGSPELTELKSRYTKKCEELFGKIDQESPDMIAFQELVLEAIAESPEAVGALKQVLLKQKEKREQSMKTYDGVLVVDETGTITERNNIISGENQ